MVTPKTGPYTHAELLRQLESSIDPVYFQPFIEAGDGEGLEVFTQHIAQFVRISQAIDRTTQAMFVLPWSGQTDEPASGGSVATVELTITRTNNHRPDVPLVFEPGDFVVEEQTTDFRPETDPVNMILTGRFYQVVSRAVLEPGDIGPITIMASAIAQGYGFNNPLPETIKAIHQPGASLSNDRGSVTQGVPVHRLDCLPTPDVLLPEHVGRYVRFEAGGNAGQITRIVGYERPNPGASPPTGGTAILARITIAHVDNASLVGTFQVGEPVTFANGIVGELIALSATFGIVERSDGLPGVGTLTGSVSGATINVSGIVQSGELAPEVRSATWRILDWVGDLGVSVTNVSSPEGGAAPVLDQLGDERDINRSPGESDDSYRQRVASLPDVVSPNAIRRTVNRIVAPLGAEGCLREIGRPEFQGWFLDGDSFSDDPSIFFAYDLDYTVYTGSPWKIGGHLIHHEKVVQVGPSGRRVEAYVDVDPSNVARVLGFFGFDPYDSQFEPIVAFPGMDTHLVIGQTSGHAWVPSAQTTVGMQPRDRFKLIMNYEEFRAFFMMGLPPLPLGEFGFFLDAGAYGYFDASPFLMFFDGFPVTGAIIRRTVWQAILEARAYGVGFDLYTETTGCN